MFSYYSIVNILSLSQSVSQSLTLSFFLFLSYPIKHGILFVKKKTV